MVVRTLQALPSWALYQTVRLMMRGLAWRRWKQGKYKLGWQLVSEQLVSEPATLLYLLVSTPRWNPHAVTAGTGVLQVERTVRFNPASLIARHWTLVATSFPSLEHGVFVSSVDAGERGVLDLKPGLYRITARMYEPGLDARLPALLVDDRAVVEEAEIPSDTNQFYAALPRSRTRLHERIHAHVPALLDLQQVLPRLVQASYLPAGNPETTFRFGAVQAGDTLKVVVDPALLRDTDAYLCVYGRASIPLIYERLEPGEQSIGPVPEEGSWLLRILRPSAEPGAVHIERMSKTPR
jgi:hypothetical protein